MTTPIEHAGAGPKAPILQVQDLVVTFPGRRGSSTTVIHGVSFDLAPGKYVLICNIVQTEPDGSKEAHYKVGMRTAFTVTAP